jgi:hypothetical protein
MRTPGTRQPSRTTHTLGGWHVLRPRARLRREPVRSDASRGRLGGLGPAPPIEVALVAWSRALSEISVRPADRRPPVHRARGFFETAHALVEDLTVKREVIALFVHLDHFDATPRLARALVAG